VYLVETNQTPNPDTARVAPVSIAAELAKLTLAEMRPASQVGPDGKAVSPKRLAVIRADKLVGNGSGSIIDTMTDVEVLAALNRHGYRSYSDALRWARAAHRYATEAALKAQRDALKAKTSKA
jgi:hypothetical protein